jgi:hypothetical protein
MLLQNAIRDLREHIQKCRDEVNAQEASASQEYVLYSKSMKGSLLQLIQLQSLEIPEETDLAGLEAYIASWGAGEETGETFGEGQYKDVTTLLAALKLRQLKEDTGHEKLLEIFRLRNLKTIRVIEEGFVEELGRLKVVACSLFDLVIKCPEEVRALKKTLLENRGWVEYLAFVTSTFSPFTKSLIEHCVKYVINWEECLSAAAKENSDNKAKLEKRYQLACQNLSKIKTKFVEQKKSLEKEKFFGNIHNQSSEERAMDDLHEADTTYKSLLDQLANELKGGLFHTMQSVNKVLTSTAPIFEMFEVLGATSPQNTNNTVSKSGDRDLLFKDHALDTLLNRKNELNITSQYIYEEKFDKTAVRRSLDSFLREWIQSVGFYLNDTNTIAKISSKAKQKGSVEDILGLLDISREDRYLMTVHRYEARVNKASLPYNGLLFLLTDYLIFHGRSFGNSTILLIPYACISKLSNIRNFLGASNGVELATIKGRVSLYLANASTRDSVAQSLQSSLDRLSILHKSLLYKSLLFRESYLTGSGEREYPPALKEQAHRRFLFVRGKLMLRRFNINEPAAKQRVPNTSLPAFVNHVFGPSKGRYKSVEMGDFLGYWREVNGATEVLPDESFNPLDYEQGEAGVDLEGFLCSAPVQEVECKYTMPKVGCITERIVMYSLSAEQTCVVISISGGKIYFEDDFLLLLTQVKEESAMEARPHLELSLFERPDHKDAQAVHELYGYQLVKEMVDFVESKAAFLAGNHSSLFTIN